MFLEANECRKNLHFYFESVRVCYLEECARSLTKGYQFSSVVNNVYGNKIKFVKKNELYFSD